MPKQKLSTLEFILKKLAVLSQAYAEAQAASRAPLHHEHDWSDIENVPDFTDADKIDGYHVEVMYPSEFDPSTARGDTIYFLYKTSERIVPIPSTQQTAYVPGWNGYLPEEGTGWEYVGTPTPAYNIGTYTYQIRLSRSDAVWSDGTNGEKTLAVVIQPYIVEVNDSVTVVYTGSPIEATQICYPPQGVTCSYVVIEGEDPMVYEGNYVVRLSLSDPNCQFDTGATKDVSVLVSAHIQSWAFGGTFPIIFSEQGTSWSFGGPFPLIFM